MFAGSLTVAQLPGPVNAPVLQSTSGVYSSGSLTGIDGEGVLGMVPPLRNSCPDGKSTAHAFALCFPAADPCRFGLASHLGAALMSIRNVVPCGLLLASTRAP